MSSNLLIFSVIVVGCISANPIARGTRIAGGYPIQNITETPWQVAIHMNGFFVCGGAIISNEWILTAASCIKLFTIAEFDVNIGSLQKFRDGLLIPAEKAIKRGDIGLILLGEKLTFTDKIQPIAPPDYGDVTVPTGDVCFISGWGSTLNASDSNEYLRGVNVPIVDHERCRRAYADLDFLIFHRDVCAGYFEGGKGACEGDFGSALVRIDEETDKPVAIGVAVFGFGCARPRYPGIYARTITVREWIHANTGI